MKPELLIVSINFIEFRDISVMSPDNSSSTNRPLYINAIWMCFAGNRQNESTRRTTNPRLWRRTLRIIFPWHLYFQNFRISTNFTSISVWFTWTTVSSGGISSEWIVYSGHDDGEGPRHERRIRRNLIAQIGSPWRIAWVWEKGSKPARDWENLVWPAAI